MALLYSYLRNYWKLVILAARADRGLDTVIGEGGVKVSGGEKERLSIARALLRKPRLLVFDEATSALDSLTEEEITATIREISARQDIIVILIATASPRSCTPTGFSCWKRGASWSRGVTRIYAENGRPPGDALPDNLAVNVQFPGVNVKPSQKLIRA